jgi:acetyl-CoA acetyltransferase
MNAFPGIAIVGVGESDIGATSGRSVFGLMADAACAALTDAGLEKSEVDGLFCAGLPAYPTQVMGEYLGITPNFADSTQAGGASFEFYIEHAAAAIAAGLCHTALFLYGSTQRADQARKLGGSVPSTYPGSQFELPYGPLLPISGYALAAKRHMFEYGTTAEQLASIAVSTRQWATMNPRAFARDPITIDDVLESGLVSSPFHRLDICLVTDGAAAVIVTSVERARSLRKPLITVLGAASNHTHYSITQMPDVTRTGASESGRRALEMAGVTHDDIDVAEIYDSFTYTVLTSLEDLGFCAKGEGGAFVEDGRLGPGGEFPTNTQGGGLSYTHPGMFGAFLITEVVRQLRGDAGAAQVPDARIGLVHGTGGVLSSHATLIVARE